MLRPAFALSSLTAVVNCLLQCPENPGWNVIDQNGGTGGRWEIPGDFTLLKTPLHGGTSLARGSTTHIAVNFTLASAFDNVNLKCRGETTTETPGDWTLDNPGEGTLNGTCTYPGTLMGTVDTVFQYNLDYTVSDLYVYQDFECNRTAHGRPWRVHADNINKQIDLNCDETGLQCGSLDPYDFGVYYVPLFPPPPLTNCSAGVTEVPFIISNITYNSVQSTENAPVLGAAYVVMSMPLIDFTMRCLPSGDEMAWTYKGSSETWYDCKTDFTNAIYTPPTWIKFNHTTFEVTVRQDFACDSTDQSHPENLTAQGSTFVPNECSQTYKGQDCWSIDIATISARFQPRTDFQNKMQSSTPDSTRQQIELLMKAGVVSKERLNPDRLLAWSGGD